MSLICFTQLQKCTFILANFKILNSNYRITYNEFNILKLLTKYIAVIKQHVFNQKWFIDKYLYTTYYYDSYNDINVLIAGIKTKQNN